MLRRLRGGVQAGGETPPVNQDTIAWRNLVDAALSRFREPPLCSALVNSLLQAGLRSWEPQLELRWCMPIVTLLVCMQSLFYQDLPAQMSAGRPQSDLQVWLTSQVDELGLSEEARYCSLCCCLACLACWDLVSKHAYVRTCAYVHV